MSFSKSTVAAGALLVPLLVVCGCTERHDPDPRTKTPLVQLTSVQSASGSNRGFTGVVVARVQSNLGFRVPGKVTERLVDAGQFVRIGQPLMRMDRTDYTHAITAQAESVEAAKARALQTAADEARYRGLVSTGATSASTYDQIKADADAARDQLAAAEARARIASDEGEYTTLLADADGVIVETLAEPGQVVTAGQTVIKLAHAGPREASVNLPEALDRPRLGSVTKAVLYGKAGEQYDAKLRQLSDSADPSTRTFEARYVLGGEAAKAPLGETVTVYLDSKVAPALEVPLAAVFDPGGGPGVWVFDKERSSVHFHRVRILRLGVETATVSDGVRVGDQVVSLAPHLLHDGETVRTDEARADAR